MAGYIGGKVAVSAPQQIETKHTITATASQTSIPNVGYTVGAVHVYQNGIRLVDGTDYTATNGSTVTLETGATEGDQIVIVSHGSFETGDVVSKASGGTFSGNVTVSGNVTATGSVTANSLVVPDGSIPLVDLDIDGGTDIGAALVDADLMVVDDGAGGTNRKATMSRLATYMGTKIGGGLEFIASSGAISNAATADFTSKIDASKYDSYKFFFHSVIPATDGASFGARLSADNGSSYDTGGGSYHKMEGSSTAGTSDLSYLQVATSIDDGAGGGHSGEGQLFNAGSSSSNTLLVNLGAKAHNSGSAGDFRYTDRGGAYVASTAAHTAIRFLFTSGNIASGEITMFGVVNS